MKFKKMEIYGFKSFADKIEVKFESGVTGIVGPNGCGKSNVADSVRWVLGEQSAKALRGSSMQDVIFNGTEKRKSQSFCEVSLYFDNTEKIFPNLEYDEVVITRKLYRSGDSEYLINKSPCRLKDILDSLRDSGLGKESYSIIGQGRIDELLSAKPEDRRAVFEEAAGISKLKNRKVEAERKLEHTKDNLLRLSDIISELELQLGPLKKQSENAKKFLEYRDRLKTLEVNTYIYQYDSASSSKAIINEKIKGISEEIAIKEADFAKYLDLYNGTLEEIKNIDKNIESLRDELLNLTVGLEKQSGEVKLVEERIANYKEQNKRASEDILSAENDFKQYGILLDIREKDKELKTKILDELEDKLAKASENYLAIVDKITKSEEDAESTNTEMIEALDMLSNVKADVSSLNTERENLKSKISELDLRIKDIDYKSESYNDELVDISTNINKFTNQKRDFELNFDKIAENITITNNKIDEVNDNLTDLRAEFHAVQSRYSVLSEMQKLNEGYIASVRKILQDSKTNASLGGKIVGVVAKLMTVPAKYESAIEMALGSSVQNLVTKNEDDAKYVIEYLKENKIGRATFMPISSMKSRYIESQYLAAIKSQKGACGVATDLISYDKSLENVFSSLLGATVIVDNIDNAVELAKKTRYSFKIVTLDGDVINPQGTMSGGSKKEQSTNIIGREREIEDLKTRSQSINKDINKLNNDLTKLKLELSDLTNSQKEVELSIHQKEVELVKENDKKAKISSFINDLETEKKSILESKQSVEQKIKAIDRALSLKLEKEREISDIKDNASESKRQSSSEFDKLKKRRESYYEEITEIKVKKASIESELVAINSDIDRATKGKNDLTYSIKEKKLALQMNLTEIAKLNSQFEEMTKSSKYSENLKALQGVRDKLANLDTFKSELNHKLSKYDELKMTLTNEIQSANDKKYREEMMLHKIDSDIETLQERVFEEYELTYSSALPFRVEGFNLEEGISETAKIKKAISHLGYVNVNAIEQLSEVSARYDDLSSQKSDLESAETDLNKIIKELVAQMEDKFKSEFDKINENFKQVFKELFGGGKAELRLREDEPVLEAGVDIVAEPPGKKLQSITLLSGGERALTAIAILFAILKLKPMPFCILDEIEAALDDANAERFARYLKRFSKSTQFIVITHRKPTMELADTLYGVTMEEKGVSKMVSVKLSDAIKNSTEANS